MSKFKMGDLVEFIPENFDYPMWKVRLIGVGYVENITATVGSDGKTYKLYYVYCGKIIKQQMKNFVEIEVKDQTFELVECEMEKVCRKLNSK